MFENPELERLIRKSWDELKGNPPLPHDLRDFATRVLELAAVQCEAQPCNAKPNCHLLDAEKIRDLMKVKP